MAGSIQPGETDKFYFDFTGEIGGSGDISDATWTCEVAAMSAISDPDAPTRIIGPVTFDATKTGCLVGGMLDGVLYTLRTTVTVDDGRTLKGYTDVACIAQPQQADLVVIPGVALFDYAEWTKRFPVFADLAPETAEQFFAMATTMHANDGSGPFRDNTEMQRTALFLLTAHIAQLSGGSGLPSWVLGRISSASQGPISVSTDGFGFKGPLSAWYGATAYGAQYWVMMAKFRTFAWRPGPPNRAGVLAGVYGRRRMF